MRFLILKTHICGVHLTSEIARIHSQICPLGLPQFVSLWFQRLLIYVRTSQLLPQFTEVFTKSSTFSIFSTSFVAVPTGFMTLRCLHDEAGSKCSLLSFEFRSGICLFMALSVCVLAFVWSALFFEGEKKVYQEFNILSFHYFLLAISP